ncbi:Heavy metal-associated isoprenylated plant protein 8, partial [Linum perenne]
KNPGDDVIFRALIHCEGCTTQINKCLAGFGGVEDVSIEKENNIVVANGNNLDPLKLLARLRNKYSRNVELISPIPKPKPEIQDKAEPPPVKPEPKIKTLVLKVLMHCQGCADDIEKTVGKMQGVVSVEAEMKSSRVVVIGFFDTERLVEKMRKQLGKQVEVVEVVEVVVLKQQPAESKAAKDEEAKVVEKAAAAADDDQYVCFCTPHPQHQTCPPCLIFSDENALACSIM